MQVGKPEATIRTALNSCEPLGELPFSVVDEIFSRMEQRDYDPGELLIRQGDPGDCLLVLVNGSARIVVHGVDGARDEIGSLCAGDIVGEHTVLFGSLGEHVELKHSAHSRDTFVRGAIRAAQFVAGKKPGLYSMEDVLGIS